MPKYRVPRYCEFVQWIEIDAEDEGLACELADEIEDDDKWSQWEPCGEYEMNHDLVELVEMVKDDE